MSCRATIADGRVIVSDPSRLLVGRHRSQMAVWGFSFDANANTYSGKPDEQRVLEKVAKYLARFRIPLDLSAEAELARSAVEQASLELSRAINAGAQFKEAEAPPPHAKEFLEFLKDKPRRLKAHQIKAALHLLAVGNGANFSVPGSGKTTVVLAVYDWLKSRGEIDSLFVIGPPSCFAPWRAEYEAVIGRKPSFEVLAGGDVDERQQKYYANKEDICDLYLTSYQTLQRDWQRVKILLNHRDARFVLVVDEAHYIKQPNGAWAEAVLGLAASAKMRCVLTGTPFPHSYSDAFNYFDVLWPQQSPLSQHDRILIASAVKRKDDDDAINLLSTRIGPLFYRVRKRDLGLAPQSFLPPIKIQMNKHERRVYESVVEKIRNLAIGDSYQEFELLTKIKRGRMMRLRQSLSYARLLGTAVSEYNENLLEGQLSLADTIKHYDKLETPGKLTATINLVRDLRLQNKKVVIWSNFVQTLKLIKGTLEASGYRAELIYGETPTETQSENDELTREQVIADFVNPESGLDILIANPAACAESISLHKECSHAIYYDLSYNCAQYLQSLDRIHRVGGSEDKVATYHFLQYADSLDEDILANLLRKADNMSAIIDQDCPVYSLDMFSEEDELAAYERLFK